MNGNRNANRGWRAIGRKGVFEILHVLEKDGRKRFSAISGELEDLCLATLTSALTIAGDLGLVRKFSYKIADDGTLQEIPKDIVKRGVRAQATFYEIEKKGKDIIELQERLGEILRSA